MVIENRYLQLRESARLSIALSVCALPNGCSSRDTRNVHAYTISYYLLFLGEGCVFVETWKKIGDKWRKKGWCVSLLNSVTINFMRVRAWPLPASFVRVPVVSHFLHNMYISL